MTKYKTKKELFNELANTEYYKNLLDKTPKDIKRCLYTYYNCNYEKFYLKDLVDIWEKLITEKSLKDVYIEICDSDYSDPSFGLYCDGKESDKEVEYRINETKKQINRVIKDQLKKYETVDDKKKVAIKNMKKEMKKYKIDVSELG